MVSKQQHLSQQISISVCIKGLFLYAYVSMYIYKNIHMSAPEEIEGRGKLITIEFHPTSVYLLLISLNVDSDFQIS